MPTRPRLRSGNASMITTTGSFLGTVIMRPIGPTCFGRYSSISSALSRICCVTHSPRPQKNELVSEQGFRRLFYTSHFLPNQYSVVLLVHDFRPWDTGQKVLLPVLVPFGRFARRRPTRPSFKLPDECGGIFRAVIIKKIVRKILVRKILVRKILVRKILVRKILVRKILVRKILVRKILGHLIAVGAPETVL